MRGSRVAWMIVAAVAAAGCGGDVDTASGIGEPLATSTVTTSLITTSVVTTSPVTTSPVTSSPVTTSAVTTSPVGGADLVPWEGRWNAVDAVVDGEPVAIVAPIVIATYGTAMSGTAACNSFEYGMSVEGDTVRFTGGFVTAVGCEAPIQRLEELFLGTIGPESTLTVDADRLTLANERATWTFERLPEPQPASLVGTRWMLSGRWLGEMGGVSFTDGMQDGFLVLADDGTVTGSTGCRPFTGTWAETDGRVMASIEADGVCTGRLVEDDTTLLTLLADGAVAELDDRRLLLLADDVTGYLFVAE